MTRPADGSDLRPRELAELSALADGTLEPRREEAVRARIAASPALTELFEREQRVVAMLHEARAAERAPHGLRERIEAQRPSRPVRARRRTLYVGGLAAALAAVVLALVLVLPSGTPGGPSVSEAAALGLLAPDAPAPVANPAAPRLQLGESVGDIYFPNWAHEFGWKASGVRTDEIRGRTAVTVYYDWHGKRIAYTIVGAPALATPRARVSRRNGTVFRTLRIGERTVVTWRRDDHTCVLSAKDVPADELRMLAAWRVPGESV
jgi:hypothetical protein